MDISPNITPEDLVEVNDWLNSRPAVEWCRIVAQRIYKDEVGEISVTYMYERLH